MERKNYQSVDSEGVLFQVLKEAEEDVRKGNVAPIEVTFQDIRKILEN